MQVFKHYIRSVTFIIRRGNFSPTQQKINSPTNCKIKKQLCQSLLFNFFGTAALIWIFITTAEATFMILKRVVVESKYCVLSSCCIAAHLQWNIIYSDCAIMASYAKYYTSFPLFYVLGGLKKLFKRLCVGICNLTVYRKIQRILSSHKDIVTNSITHKWCIHRWRQLCRSRLKL